MDNENKNPKKQKRSAIGYYSVVAFSLAVIGSVSWFAATKTTKKDGYIRPKASEYQSDTGSYNNTKEQENTENTEKTESAANTVSDEPYTTESKPAENEKIKYVMPVEGAILKPFSSVDLQYSSTYADMRLHEGVDIKCNEGSIVKSAYKGTVTDILDDSLYGKVVVIDHGNGVTVRYCGLKDIAVKAGQTVEAGEQIAFSGEVPCECADEPHIHIDAIIDNENISVFDLLN